MIRVACGKGAIDELPKGVRSNPDSCPIATALKDVSPNVKVRGAEISGLPGSASHRVAHALNTEVVETNGTATVRSNEDVRQFVREFDGGNLPEYDRNRSAARW